MLEQFKVYYRDVAGTRHVAQIGASGMEDARARAYGLDGIHVVDAVSRLNCDFIPHNYANV